MKFLYVTGKIQIEIIFESASGDGTAFYFGQVEPCLGKPGENGVQGTRNVREGKTKR